MRFFDEAKVAAVLERLPRMPPRERNAWDVALTLAASACLMQGRFRLG